QDAQIPLFRLDEIARPGEKRPRSRHQRRQLGGPPPQKAEQSRGLHCVGGTRHGSPLTTASARLATPASRQSTIRNGWSRLLVSQTSAVRLKTAPDGIRASTSMVWARP